MAKGELMGCFHKSWKKHIHITVLLFPKQKNNSILRHQRRRHTISKWFTFSVFPAFQTCFLFISKCGFLKRENVADRHLLQSQVIINNCWFTALEMHKVISCDWIFLGGRFCFDFGYDIVRSYSKSVILTLKLKLWLF